MRLKEYRCILVQHKEAKCEVERLKGELVEAYSKIKFLELEIIQANVMEVLAANPRRK